MWMDRGNLVVATGYEGRSTEGGCVLVVEGDDVLAASLTEVLMQAGYVVVAVSSAEAGLHALRACTFSCLVVNLGLPDLRGDLFYTMARLQQPQLGDRTVFVTKTAADQAAWAIPGLRCPVLCTPFTSAALLKVVGPRAEGASETRT